MRPVPILFLFPSLGVGGAERQMQALALGLDRARWRPIVACQHASGPVGDALVAAGCEVHRLSGTRRFDPLFLWRATALMRREGVRIVLTHGFSTGVVGRLAALLGGAPVRIVAEHSTGERDMSAARHRINRLLVPITSAWVAVARGQVPYLIETKRIPADRIHVVHNGIDVAAHDLGVQRATERARVRREFGIDADAPVAGIIAVLRPEKDLATFVHAAQRVLRELPAARFVMAGDGPERHEIEREIDSLGLERRVIMTGWRSDVPAVLAALDVAVLCSTDVETFPLVFLEAMAAGLPLVGTRVGGLAEMIEDGENGLLVEPRDAEQLARAMLRVLGDGETARRWGAASHARVVQEFDVATMVARYEALFARLLSARARQPAFAR